MATWKVPNGVINSKLQFLDIYIASVECQPITKRVKRGIRVLAPQRNEKREKGGNRLDGNEKM